MIVTIIFKQDHENAFDGVLVKGWITGWNDKHTVMYVQPPSRQQSSEPQWPESVPLESVQSIHFH